MYKHEIFVVDAAGFLIRAFPTDEVDLADGTRAPAFIPIEVVEIEDEYAPKE